MTEVHYVPSLKKNLSSLGALESKGLIVILKDGGLEVMLGTLVIMKGIRRNNLYYYQCSTVIGTTTIGSTENKESEATKMWHMRLGHPGEKFL